MDCELKYRTFADYDGFDSSNGNLEKELIKKGNKLNKQLKNISTGAIAFFVTGLLSITGSLLFWIIPSMLLDQANIYYFIVTFFFFNVALNYLAVVHYSSFYSASNNYNELPQADWKLCSCCQVMAPPRSHHCIVCNQCVLRRDHHCYFTNNCIGFYNQRHFIAFCFHVASGSALALYFYISFIMNYYESPFSWQFYQYLLPVVMIKGMFLYVPLSFVCLITLTWMSFATGLGSSIMLFWQLFISFQGLTSYEFMKKRNLQRIPNIRKNFKSIFGQCGIVQFLLPLPLLKIQGNGIYWHSSAKVI